MENNEKDATLSVGDAVASLIGAVNDGGWGQQFDTASGERSSTVEEAIRSLNAAIDNVVREAVRNALSPR